MPESPEVSYLTKYIAKYCQGRALNSVEILQGRYKNHGPPENFAKFAKELPLKLVDVKKKGKVILLCFENDWTIVSRLGLMGWWYVDGDPPQWAKSRPNLQFVFRGETLFYTDYKNQRNLRLEIII